MSKPDPQGIQIDSTTLDVCPGHTPASAPPVEILLLSKDAHQRAERVFVWSIECVRNPARVYRIHFVRDARDRVAAEFVAETARVIVNEVGQIYFSDPALLFDLDFEGSFVRKVSRDATSPLLLDIAQRARKAEDASPDLQPAQWIARARESGVAWKRLDDLWRPRNEADADPREGHLFHFKVTHLLPWRPHLDRCIHHKSPQQALFVELEEAASAAGFEIFGPETPSRVFEAMAAAPSSHGPAAHDAAFEARSTPFGRADADEIRELIDRTGAERVIDCSALYRGQRFEAAGLVAVAPFDLVTRTPSVEPADVVVCHDWLDGLPVHDLGWVLAVLFATARRSLHLGVTVQRGSARPVDFWRERIESAATHYPTVHWCLRVAEVDETGTITSQRQIHGGAWLAATPPRVWVLADDRPGNATQSIGLASALAWPTEIKKIHYRAIAFLHNRILGASKLGLDLKRSTPLQPPWPDLVIACGRRTAPIARWVRKQSKGRTRVVALGRKAGDDAELFDLSVTPQYTRCLPHPRRMETWAPLHRMTSEVLREAAKEWGPRLANDAAAPRIAVLVGGTSGQYWFGARSARKLGEQVASLADSVGASLWVSTSRRTGKSQTEALKHALAEIDRFYAWSAGGEDNPYRGYLACADAFVITADSESMLAEACATGKPVYVYQMEWRASFRALSFFRDLVVKGSGMNDRCGEADAVQGRVAHFCSWLLARGFVRPTRDLDRLHESLVERGVVREFGTPLDADSQAPLFELDEVAERVRRLMGFEPR